MSNIPNKKLKIAVLMGGPSSEHEVSLATGREVVDALDKNKYKVTPVIIPKIGRWEMPEDTDVAFIALHGPYGEDGTIQGFLEAKSLVHTGSGILASALAMNKAKTTQVYAQNDLAVPEQFCFNQQEWKSDKNKIILKIKNKLKIPCVIKPRSSGSSVGVSVAKTSGELLSALDSAFKEDKYVLAEQYIKGTEVTCGVLDEGGGRNAFALIPLEIIPKKSDFYDYDSKYADGGSEHLIPRLSKKIIKSIQDQALRAHLALGCSGMSRTDMIVRDGEIFLIETNTIPGMTKTSLLPQAASMSGITFPKLLDKIIKAALNEK